MREVAGRALLAELEDDLLGSVDEIGHLAVAFLPQADDLLAGPDEPPQGRHLLDDARVVLDVRRGRDERGELDHAPLATSSLELPALVELVDERDRVDRLALRPQRERGEVHLRVALAVEICFEDLADGSDGDRREQHRAEHGLLGLEVLWRDDRAQAVADALEVDVGGLGLAHGVGSQAVREGRVQPEREAPSSQGERNIRSQPIPACGRTANRLPRIVNPETRAPSANFHEFSTRLWRRRGLASSTRRRRPRAGAGAVRGRAPRTSSGGARPRGTTAFRG